MEARLWVTTYAKYNAGTLIGKWFDLDEYASRDEFLAAATAYVAEADPELMFCDYEGFPAAWYCESSAPPDELWDWLEMSDEDKALAKLLAEVGINMEPGDAMIYEGSAENYAAELVADCYDLPEIAERYFDYEAFARDLVLGGDIVELAPDVWLTNPNG